MSSVAEKMLKKMGWSKGEGLGKDKQGISTHITVTKRKDDEGIGAEKIQAAEFGDTWWNGALEKTMYKMKVGLSWASFMLWRRLVHTVWKPVGTFLRFTHAIRRRPLLSR